MPNPIFLAALGWLGKAIDIVRGLRRRAKRKIVKVQNYLEDILSLEEETGDEANAWAKIKEGFEQAQPVQLTPIEARYLHEFKVLWDRYFKKPLKLLVDVLGPDDDDDD